MRWTVRDVADMFQVSENIIARWVRNEGLPANNVCGELRFNVMSVLEWVSVHDKPISDRFVQALEGVTGQTSNLADALERGGIVQRVVGPDKPALAREIVAELTLPERADRQAFESILLSRKDLGLSPIGDGVALPRPDSPLIVPHAQPAVTLYFLQATLPLDNGKTLPTDGDKRLPLDKPNGRGIDTLFLFVCPTVGCHLSLLARLEAALQDLEFRDLVKRRHAHDHIFRAAHRLQPVASSSIYEPVLRSD
jgi:nitrogen PTS system EIIA component